MEIYKNCIYGYPKSVDTGNKISTFVEQFYTLAPGEKRKYAHTLVTDTDVFYHGHQIVHRNLNDSIWIRTKGWFSTATKRRLNAILKRHGLFLFKRDGDWYFSNGKYSIPYFEFTTKDGGLTNGYQWISVDEVLQTFNKKGLT